MNQEVVAVHVALTVMSSDEGQSPILAKTVPVGRSLVTA